MKEPSINLKMQHKLLNPLPVFKWWEGFLEVEWGCNRMGVEGHNRGRSGPGGSLIFIFKQLECEGYHYFEHPKAAWSPTYTHLGVSSI